MLQKHSPRLETRFVKTVVISPLWASFTLWLSSTSPVTKTGQRKEEGEQKKWRKSEIFCTHKGDRKRCCWGRHSSLNFFCFKSICQVKVALSHIRFWQTQVAAGDRCLNFLKFKDFAAHKSSNMILVTCALNPNSVVKKMFATDEAGNSLMLMRCLHFTHQFHHILDLSRRQECFYIKPLHCGLKVVHKMFFF